VSRVAFQDVTKAYPGSVIAVRELTLEVADGEFLILVGPSGCGKTTALRMVAGLERISRGTITIGDRIVNDVPPKDRDVAMVFQNYALYPHMTVEKNLGFGLRRRRIARVGSASGWRWDGHSFVSPRCSSSMSRCRTWTRSSASRCARS
jgi:multiple sugar transport system ATP-binding protein